MLFKGKEVLGLLLLPPGSKLAAASPQGVLWWCSGGREDRPDKLCMGRVAPGRPMFHVPEAGLDLSLFLSTFLL